MTWLSSRTFNDVDNERGIMGKENMHNDNCVLRICDNVEVGYHVSREK